MGISKYFENLIYDSSVTHLYAICIFHDSSSNDFFAYKIFSNPPTQNFEDRLSEKCVSVYVFGPYIWIDWLQTIFREKVKSQSLGNRTRKSNIFLF